MEHGEPLNRGAGAALFARQCDPFDCRVELPGWRIYLAQLAVNEGRDLGDVMGLAIGSALDWLTRRSPEGSPVTPDSRLALREALAREAIGVPCVRPSSEILSERLAAGPAAADGSLAWQSLCVLVARSAAPWSVLDRKALAPPLRFRLGLGGESLRHEGEPLPCAGLPVLADQRGVVASPWTLDSAAALEGCLNPVFVCYLPVELMRRIDPKHHLGRLVWLTWAYTFAFARVYSFREPTS